MSPTTALDKNLLVADSADSAYANTLRALLRDGLECKAGASLSVGSGKASKEILNFSCLLTDPLRRLPLNPARKINLPAAVARFVWMMAGSDRLADIAFYEPKVRFFSDDGIAVPGSSYGQRILRSRPGLNQLESAIARLKQDPYSRRAAISIYHPEDAVRESRDIPCAFGIFYHVRDGQLIATTLMRSNNAFVLLPYNVFEFSLLAEAVAVEVGVPLGALYHSAVSMHVYEDNYSAADSIVRSFDAWSPSSKPIQLPSIPAASSPLESIKKLVILEADLRHASAGLSGDSIEEWIDKGSSELDAYWRQQFFLLLLHVAKKNENGPALSALESVITDPWKSYVGPSAFVPAESAAQSAAQLVELELPLGAYRAGNVIPLHSTRVLKSLKLRAAAFEQAGKGTVTWAEFAAMEEKFGAQLAASGSDRDLSDDEFAEALAALRTQPRSST